MTDTADPRHNPSGQRWALVLSTPTSLSLSMHSSKEEVLKALDLAETHAFNLGTTVEAKYKRLD